jgi:hypothetical protein
MLSALHWGYSRLTGISTSSLGDEAAIARLEAIFDKRSAKRIAALGPHSRHP